MTEQSPWTAEDERTAILQHFLDNPHHMPPARRWLVRRGNGVPIEQAMQMLRQEITVADAKHAREALS